MPGHFTHRRGNTDAAATLPMPSLVSQTLAATLLFLCGTTVRAAEHIGGHNSQVQAAECTIATVFTKLQEIKTADACTSGCAGGECPTDWYPSEADACSVECGQIFEPFCARCLPLMCLGAAPSPQSHSACDLCLTTLTDVVRARRGQLWADADPGEYGGNG